MNVHLESYGCSANIADAEIISGLLSQYDYNILSDDLHAD